MAVEPRSTLRRIAADGRLRLIAGTAALALSPAIVGVLAARALGPDGRGELAVGLALGTIAGTIGVRGMDVALLAAAPGAVQAAAVRTVVKQRSGMVLVVEGVVAALIVLFVLGVDALPVALVVPAFTMAATRFAVVRAANLGAGHSGAVLGGDITSAGVSLALAVVATIVAPHPAVYVGAALVGLVSGSVVALRPFPRNAPGVAEVDVWRPGDIARFAWLGRALQTVAFRLDRVVLAVLAGSTATGLYAAAVPLAEMITIFPLHLAQLTTVRIARSDDRARWFLHRDTQLLLGGSAVGSVALVAAAPWLVELIYGADFVGAVDALRVLAVASLVSVVWRFAEAELYATGRARAAVSATAVAAVVVLSVTAALSSAGAVAASYGSLVGYTAGATIALIAARGVGRA